MLGDEYDMRLSVVGRAAALVLRIESEMHVEVVDSNTIGSAITVLCELIVKQQQQIEEMAGKINDFTRGRTGGIVISEWAKKPECWKGNKS